MNYDITTYLNLLIQENLFLESFVYIVARYGDVSLIFILVVFFFIHRHTTTYICIDPIRISTRAKEISASLVVGFATWVLVLWIKFVTAIQRPFMVIPEIEPLFEYTKNMSFPSGHTAFFTALGVSLFFEHKRLGILVCMLALCIGVARVMSGVHFFFDIVAGFVLGIVVAFLVRMVGRKSVRFWLRNQK
jgi:membrane-associated phospholipid phosphatase